MKKKSGRKQDVKSSNERSRNISWPGNDNDSTLATRGTKIDYTKYLLLFKVKADTSRFDSLIVFHTNEFKTLRQSDQNRLDYLLRELFPKKILMVYVKELLAPGIEEEAYVGIKRRRSIAKYLHGSGIPYALIKNVYE